MHCLIHTHRQSFCYVLVDVFSWGIGGVTPELLNLGDPGHHLQVSEENCRGVRFENHLFVATTMLMVVMLSTRLFESVSIALESANFCSASRTKITSF